MSRIERLPSTWDSEHDEAFFRIVATVLPRAVVDGGSCLLSTYDDEDDWCTAPLPRAVARTERVPFAAGQVA